MTSTDPEYFNITVFGQTRDCTFASYPVVGSVPNSVHTEDVVGNAHVRSFSDRPHPKRTVTFLVTWPIANIRVEVFHNGTPEPANRVPWS